MSTKAFRFVILCLIMAAIGFAPIQRKAPQQVGAVPQAAQTAAEEGLRFYMGILQPEVLAEMGFRTPEDIQGAILGEPYPRYLLTGDAVRAYQPGAPFKTALVSADVWLYPVMVGTEVRSILIVYWQDGQWVAGDIGGSRIPAAFQAARSQLDQALLMKRAGVIGRVKAVTMTDLEQIFFYVQTDAGEFLMPLPPPEPEMSRLAAFELLPIEDAIGAIRQQLEVQQQ